MGGARRREWLGRPVYMFLSDFHEIPAGRPGLAGGVASMLAMVNGAQRSSAMEGRHQPPPVALLVSGVGVMVDGGDGGWEQVVGRIRGTETGTRWPTAHPSYWCRSRAFLVCCVLVAFDRFPCSGVRETVWKWKRVGGAMRRSNSRYR